MKCNETLGKWYKNKHGASKIIDTFETYHPAGREVRRLSLGHLVLGRQVLHAHLISLCLGDMHAKSRKQRSAMAAAVERKS
jgi:hypothetical protein